MHNMMLTLLLIHPIMPSKPISLLEFFLVIHKVGNANNFVLLKLKICYIKKSITLNLIQNIMHKVNLQHN